MKQILTFLAIAFFVWSCNQTEPKREVKTYTIKQFMENTKAFGSSFSFDEKKILFTSNQSGIYNAFVADVETGKIEQITNSEKSAIYTSAFFPNDNRIIVESDNEGDEIFHIFLRQEDGNLKDLTPDSMSRASFYTWYHDQKAFIFGSNKRNPKFMDVYEMNIETFEPKLIFENEGGFNLGAVSNDRKYMAFSKTIIKQNSNMYLYNKDTKEMKLLSEHQGNINFRPIEFSDDNKFLYYKTDKDSEFMYIMKYNIETGESEKVFSDNWDVDYAYHSFNSKYYIVGINKDAKTEIKIFDKNNKEIKFPEFEAASIASVNISKSEKYMTFYLSASNSTSNLYFYDFETGEYKQLTNTMNPEIDKNDLVNAEVIRYKSFDGLEIPAILYKPINASKDNKVPALLYIHGGPGGQSGLGYFNSQIQFLVNHGYAVLAVNNRGSSGYGKTFEEADDMKHGDADLKDCIYAKQYFASIGWVDTSKVGILGGSYGGYMVAAALAFTPEEFAVGVNIFGVTNWLRTLKNIPPWWEDYRQALYKELGNPDTDSAYLYEISPLFHAKNITKPMMVLQGANDPRVLKIESDELVEAAKSNGAIVEYVVFDDEGHGFRKKENEIISNEKILNFLDKYLAKKEEIIKEKE
ncbi:MAG: prolyl oligopeptidase family serine peptidase [Bacteroidales bacterium]|nr:prolyl oligopeptidase family serine peptidase [Bacteroidales bacterium]MBN2757162.1 prolyl oligopeptidase family serine peptidase [Bacteroidales bacterium]